MDGDKKLFGDGKPVKFKFRYLDANGNSNENFPIRKGWLDKNGLNLEKTLYPPEALLQSFTRYNRLYVTTIQPDGSRNVIGFKLSHSVSGKVKRTLDRMASAAQIEIHRRELKEKGQERLFRAETCRYCGAMIDLTGFEMTPQMYCPFCQAVVMLRRDNAHSDENNYGICDKCGLYSRPKHFTELYVYFLGVVYGYRYKQHYMCNSCMRSTAWTMLAINMIFLFMLPFSIYQVLRSHFGGSAFNKDFAGLDKANSKVKGKRYQKAVEIYSAIEKRLGHCAGVRYNHALALMRAGQAQEAVGILNESLADCSNYAPAAAILLPLLVSTNQAEQAAALAGRFGFETSQETVSQ